MIKLNAHKNISHVGCSTERRPVDVSNDSICHFSCL
jgi:hypothetical protein